MNKLNQIFRKTFLFLALFLGLTSISNAQCVAGEVEVFIDVVTDDFGFEAYWELVPSGAGCGTPATIFSGGNPPVGCLGGGAQAQLPGGYASSSTITEPAGPSGFCLTSGNSYDIIAVDDWGDGGTCFNSVAQGFSFCMSNANNLFTFEVAAPIQDDIAVVSNAIIEYTGIPLSQVPVTGIPLSADVRNNGIVAVTDAVLTANVYEPNSNVVVQTSSSLATNIGAGLVSTINPGFFTPLAAGAHGFEYISSMTAVTDSDNTNDTLRSIIQFTDDGSYARDNATLAVALGLTAPSYGELGNVFEYPNSGYKMDSVFFYMKPSTVRDTTEVKIYDVVGGIPTTLIGTSGLIIISNTDTAGVVKTVPVTNLAGGALAITSPKVFVSLYDSYTGFIGLGFATEIYTPGGTYANINGGAWTDIANLGFPNPAIIRPYSSFDCSVLTLTTFANATSCNPLDTGVVSVTNTNQYGCDSVHTITTSLLPSSSSLTEVNACDSITWIDGNTYTASTNTATHTIQNAEGCDSTVNLDLTVFQTPLVNLTITNSILTATPGLLNYQWLLDGQAIPGATNESYAAISNGIYTCVSNNGLCEGTSSSIEVVLSSINDTNFDFIEIYPNPANNYININSGSEDIESLKLFHTSGQYIAELDPNKRGFFIGNYARGLYFIELTNKTKRSIVKVLLN